MSLLEYFGESANPGSVGSVDVVGTRRAPTSPPGWVLLRLAGAASLLVGAAYLVFGKLGVAGTTHNLAVAGVVALVYLVAGYALRPEPDMSNVGWCGGLIDNPFRWSDDWNRNLLFLAVVLLPGRFVAEALVDGLGLLVRLARRG